MERGGGATPRVKCCQQFGSNLQLAFPNRIRAGHEAGRDASDAAGGGLGRCPGASLRSFPACFGTLVCCYCAFGFFFFVPFRFFLLLFVVVSLFLYFPLSCFIVLLGSFL